MLDETKNFSLVVQKMQERKKNMISYFLVNESMNFFVWFPTEGKKSAT